jgi:hypothetical protein
MNRRTVGVTGAGADVDNVWEQKKTRSQNTPNAESSPTGEDVQRTEEVPPLHQVRDGGRSLSTKERSAVYTGSD